MEYLENALCYAGYCRLRESVGWTTPSQEQARAALRNSLYSVAVLENGQAVGMGRLIGDGMYLLMVDLVVAPAYQGKGIGRKIVGMLIAYAAKALPDGGQISIQLVSEKGTEPFYEKLGFTPIPRLSKKWLAPLFRGVHSSLAPTARPGSYARKPLLRKAFCGFDAHVAKSDYSLWGLRPPNPRGFFDRLDPECRLRIRHENGYP